MKIAPTAPRKQRAPIAPRKPRAPTAPIARILVRNLIFGSDQAAELADDKTDQCRVLCFITRPFSKLFPPSSNLLHTFLLDLVLFMSLPSLRDCVSMGNKSWLDVADTVPSILTRRPSRKGTLVIPDSYLTQQSVKEISSSTCPWVSVLVNSTPMRRRRALTTHRLLQRQGPLTDPWPFFLIFSVFFMEMASIWQRGKEETDTNASPEAKVASCTPSTVL